MPAPARDAPPVRWIFGSRRQRARALGYWVRDPIAGGLNATMYYGLRSLPTDWCSAFGAFFGGLSPGRYPESDARARRAWQTLRPEAADAASTDAAMRRLWRNVGRTMAEYSCIHRLWAEGRMEVEGEENVHALRDARRPILCTPLHLGNFELIPVTGIKLGYYGASLAIVLENRFQQRLTERIRESFGGRMVFATPTSGKAIVSELRERGPMLIYIDEYVRGRVHAPAFGRPLKNAGNISYVVRLAKMTGAAILPAYCLRIGDSARFKIKILPHYELIDTGDQDADLMTNVAALNALIEPIVRAHLDQWFYVLDLDLDA